MLDKQIIQHYERAKAERELFRPMMTDCYVYAIPSRNTWQTITPGQRQDIDIYNSHPVNSVKQFSSNIVNLLAPAGLKFFDLMCKNANQNEDEINQILSQYSDTIFDYIGISNFYNALSEACIDLSAGTGAILLNYSGKPDNPFSFTSLDNASLSFTESSDGIINNIFRDIEDMLLTTAQQLYPDADFSDHQNDVEISFVEAIIYNEKTYKFKHILFEQSSSKVYFEQELNTNPFIIFRWSKMPGEIRGRGIISDMIGSIKSANLMQRDILSASQRVIAPPTVVNQSSVIDPYNIDFSPNSLVVVKSQPGVANPIYSLPFSGNLPFGQQEITNLNVELDNALLVNPIGNVGDANQTATEITARLRQAANTLGTFWGRSQKELLSPLIMRCIDILNTASLLPKLPKQIKISYKSPIQHLQQQHDVTALMQMVQSLVQISGDNSALAINTALNIVDLPNWLADKFGVDKKIVKTTDEIKNIMNSIMQIQQQQALQQQAAQAQISGGNPALSQPVNYGVPPQ